MDPNSYILSYLEKHLDSPALWLAATFYETCVWRNVLFLQYHIYADGSPLNFSGAVSYSYLRECFQAIILSESESRSVMSNSLRPHGLYTLWNSPGQNTGVGSLSLLQWIFPTQGLNPGLLHCRQIPYQLSHKGSPHKSPNKTATHISHMVYFYFSQHIRMGKIPKHWGHICVLLPYFFFWIVWLYTCRILVLQPGIELKPSERESVCQCRRRKRRGFNLWVGKIPWSRKWQLTPVFLPRKFHEQRSLAGYSP